MKINADFSGFIVKGYRTVKKRYGLILFSLLVGSLLLAACAGSDNSLDGTNWQLNRYQDKSGDLVPVIPDTIVTAQFQATKVSGIAGCNNYNSSYQVNGNLLTFSPAATTRKICADPPTIMQQEDAYLTALEQVQSFRHRGEALEMQSSDGETILVFSPAGQ